jgi:hypothetical protein
MACFASFILILNMLCQASGVPADTDDIFSPKEKTQLQKTTSADGRINIYQKASVRLQENLKQSVANAELDTVSDTLKRWTSLLFKSFDDIKINLKAKKKSRNLINYEIHVRKAIVDTRGYKLIAPLDQQDDFDACLAQAEAIRSKMVEILFKQ